MSDIRSSWPLLSHTDSKALDHAIRGALAASLRTVYAQLPPGTPGDDDRLDHVLSRIVAGPIRPSVFGLYADLVESILSGNDAARDALGRDILQLDPRGDGTRILALTDEDLGAGQAERYARLVDDDPDRPYSILAVDGRFEDAHARVSAALQLLDEGVPELAREIRDLVREIVLVQDGGETEGRSFDGASTFYLWGAVLLNVDKATRLDLAQQIAHEAGHLLLFGLIMGQPLTENDLEERFTSPLRRDARPMEGVVHAAYVLARMSYTLARLLQSGLLSPKEEADARRDLASHHDGFFDTLPLIERHARFKPAGATAFDGAVQYMKREIGLERAIA